MITYGQLFERMREVFPSASDEVLNDVLWSCTPYPMDGCDPDRIVAQLREYGTNDPQVAMSKAEAEMRTAMEGWREDLAAVPL